MLVLCFWLFFCGLVAVFASSRGRSAFGFFLISVIFSPLIGFIIALVVQNRSSDVEFKKALKSGELKECPECAEHVKKNAKVCRYCSYSFATPAAVVIDPNADPLEEVYTEEQFDNA